MKTPSLGSLVYVRWIDSHFRPGWCSEAPSDELLTAHSVGWLVGSNKQVVTLASHVVVGDNSQRCGEMTIPTCAIRRIRNLPEP